MHPTVYNIHLLRLLSVASQVFSGRPPQGRFCGQQRIVHRKRPMLIFCSTVDYSRLKWLYFLKGISNSSRKADSLRQASREEKKKIISLIFFSQDQSLVKFLVVLKSLNW